MYTHHTCIWGPVQLFICLASAGTLKKREKSKGCNSLSNTDGPAQTTIEIDQYFVTPCHALREDIRDSKTRLSPCRLSGQSSRNPEGENQMLFPVVCQYGRQTEQRRGTYTKRLMVVATPESGVHRSSHQRVVAWIKDTAITQLHHFGPAPLIGQQILRG
jgi:hypothetical protein